MTNILIIGAGEIGLALAKLLKAHRPILWDRDLKKSSSKEPLEVMLKKAEVVFLCIPTSAYHELLPNVAKSLRLKSVVVSLSKGLLLDGKTLDEQLEQLFKQRFALMAGPMIAEEIERGGFAFTQVASPSRAVFTQIQALFGKSTLKFEYSSAVRVVAWVSVLKNIYAVLYGVADGVKAGDNVRGWLTVRMCEEMQLVVNALCPKSGESVVMLSALGDSITTGTSVTSSNHAMGVELARNPHGGWHGEGLRSLELIARHHVVLMNKLPLLKFLFDVVEGRRAAKEFPIVINEWYGA